MSRFTFGPILGFKDEKARVEVFSGISKKKGLGLDSKYSGFRKGCFLA